MCLTEHDASSHQAQQPAPFEPSSSASTTADASTATIGMLQKGHLLDALTLDKQERHTNLSENPFSTS